ncbi:hypothetical protein LEP1GSC020_2415 [Leptospira interrogans serovar Grippotyphosa str. 2006006986]|nr:hypothetical protein LEP1GSC045_2394 [Leptospira interrogans serovar Pomona str. Kennewicki LC82-25]EKN97782.1 hypothetical protein LEP1GSC014_3384 [Leptospira interrogans serovar Pomona str. Pomona]EKO69293.1 hypothetical protein LEP1GSC069_4359 [Leptospira interrogans serovar Canicola str. Fiocruz LV133]EKP86692.1 hypothetical protein LEP1GSC020_2415 [Leptospira interrogans serovar Grippotyphosa str. 2006006986]EMI64799.1 hypothetical protein LEP1GSC200_0896 [Leptospira interrogans serovar
MLIGTREFFKNSTQFRSMNRFQFLRNFYHNLFTLVIMNYIKYKFF